MGMGEEVFCSVMQIKSQGQLASLLSVWLDSWLMLDFSFSVKINHIDGMKFGGLNVKYSGGKLLCNCRIPFTWINKILSELWEPLKDYCNNYVWTLWTNHLGRVMSQQYNNRNAQWMTE